ncbi:PTPB [Mytilus edulis]|uniref:PTPRB n=1 Tax=Mytilus edulis TaxID=6550 RepID=A0A8S3TSL7_MYTED|nr:PTPB [Mytilus edulis]
MKLRLHVHSKTLCFVKTEGDNGGDCTFGVANSCLYQGQLICKSDHKCSCSNTVTHYWDATSMTCKPRGDNGGDCAYGVDNSCLYPGELVCQSDNACSCSDTNTHYWYTPSMTCKIRQLVCKSDNKCSCSDTDNNYWHAASKTCKPKKPLGGDCAVAIECLVVNSECATECQCQVNFMTPIMLILEETVNHVVVDLSVSNIQLETRSDTYLVISWTAPLAAAAVEEYRFLVGETSSEVSVGKQLEANVTGLIPGVLYTITVISVDSNSRPAVQKTSPAPVTQATMPAVPGPIDLANSDLTASDGSITINWKSTGTVTSYTVTISELVINPATVNAPSYMIGGNAALRNGHRYTLTVKAHSNSLESAEYTVMFRTVITRPNPPILQSCTEIVSTSIDLVWQEPSYPNGDVQYYLITTNGVSAPPQIDTSTNVVTYKVEPLLEEQFYCFFVRTVNDGTKDIQVSVNSNQLCCFTKAASSSEPTNVTTNVLSSRNISVSWNYPDNPKGDIFGYRLRLKVGDECQVEIQSIPYKDCGADKQRQTIILNKNQINTTINYVVEQLLPYTKYDVWIAAHSAANDGMRHESEVQTISEVPQKPLSVAALVQSSREITVTWSQPIPRPGVTIYHVKAYAVVNGTIDFVKISNVSGYSTQTVDLSQLKAFWNYTFTVVASTDKGDSAQSNMSPIVRTNQAAPGKVTSFLIRRPTNILTTMEVSWAIPSLQERNGIIKEYTISHNVSGTTTVETIAADSEVFQKLYSITPDRHYQVEIYAVNSINQVGEKERKIYYASSKIKRETDTDFSIGTVIGAAVSCLVLGVLVTVILFCLIMKRRGNETSKESRSRHVLDDPQLGDQYEDLGMDNISSYQELGVKENPNVYEQIEQQLFTKDKKITIKRKSHAINAYRKVTNDWVCLHCNKQGHRQAECNLHLSERDDTEDDNSDEDKSETEDSVKISQSILQPIPKDSQIKLSIAPLSNDKTVTSTNKS